VLQFAKYDKGQIELKKEYFDLHELIKNTEQIVHLRVQNDNGELNLHLNAKEPSILADKHHVESVISNIIDNAIKYRKEVPIIDIFTEDAPGGVKIIIADQGIGISKDIQKKIFEKFYRVSTGNLHDVKGFGLGLSYVKAIIDAHKGRIDVSSELGKGSKFEIFLPSSTN
jgi:two-component system phosphate regulon sensor histidine kinase PhoR